MNSLRHLLDELSARRGPGPESTSTSAVNRPIVNAPDQSLQSLLGGVAATSEGGPCWYIRTPVEAVRRDCDSNVPSRLDRILAEGPLLTGDCILVDIETGGFAGTPVFLVGLLDLAAEPLVVEQWLTRDYPEEEAVVRLAAERLATRAIWISFNGKSFDEPFLRDRAAAYRVPFPSPRLHLDILHAARRAWRSRLPDCRLATLERYILGVTRAADVAGTDVPDLFHHFLRTGRAAPLRLVLEHNRQDLVTSLQLLLRLGVQEGDEPGR